MHKRECAFLLTCRLAVLLPPGEWRLKTSAMLIFAYGHPSTPCKLATCNILMIYCIRVHEMFTRYRGFIGDLLMGIGFAILPTVVECQCTKWLRCVNIRRRATSRLP